MQMNSFAVACITVSLFAPIVFADENTSDKELQQLIKDLGTKSTDVVGVKAMKRLIEIGDPAVPKLLKALPEAKGTSFRRIPFVLRGIGDQRAIPALIQAIPRTIDTQGSDLGLRIENDPDLFAFVCKHDLSAGNDDGNSTHYGLGRPLREILGALKKMTGHNYGMTRINFVHANGSPLQKYFARKQFYDVAVEWADWWNDHDSAEAKKVGPVTLAPFNVKKPPRREFKPDSTFEVHGRTSHNSLGAAQSHPHYCCRDLDTGAIYGWPGLVPAKGIPLKEAMKALERRRKQFERWGIDLVCLNCKLDDQPAHNHFFAIGMEFKMVKSIAEAEKTLGQYREKKSFGFDEMGGVTHIPFDSRLVDRDAPNDKQNYAGMMMFRSREDALGVLTYFGNSEKSAGAFYTGGLFNVQFYVTKR